MTAPDKLPSQRRLNRAWRELTRVYEKHLRHHSVVLPKEGTYKQVWLSVFYCFKGQFVHKDLISRPVICGEMAGS